MKLILNLNDSVRVHLTPAGERILAEYGLEVASTNPDGSFNFSLWHLMQVFGPHIHLGMKPVFVGSNITLERY